MKKVVFGLVVFLVVLFSGCKLPFSKEAVEEAAKSAGADGTGAVFVPPTSVSVEDATVAQCSMGGIFLTTFQDANFNGLLDTDEKIVATKAVCNGAVGQNGSNGTNGTNGQDGISAGIVAEQASVASCPAGGIVVKTFVDTNRNGALNNGETVTSVNTVCNGVNGSSGANGKNAHLSVSAASSVQCSNGGSVYGSWVDGETPRYTVVCNGVNGSNGQNGQNGNDANFRMGPVGPMVKDKPYSVCHHDYLYIPGNEEIESSGWLVFRHQKNGSADQGIGATGFNVWNVDISDFALISEERSVTYCSMHWDPREKRLLFTVVDRTDGQAGLTGEISLK